MDYALTTAPGLAAVGGTFVAVNTIIVPIRFYARRKQGGTYGPDDWTAVLSFVCLPRPSLRGQQYGHCGLVGDITDTWGPGLLPRHGSDHLVWYDHKGSFLNLVADMSQQESDAAFWVIRNLLTRS